MNKHMLPIAVSAALCLAPSLAMAQTATPPPAAKEKGDAPNAPTIKQEISTIVGKVREKMQEGKTSEEDLADIVKSFDDLVAKHSGEKSDDVAQALMMKAMLYMQVIKDDAKAKTIIEQIKKDFPESEIVAGLRQEEQAEKARAGLVKGAAFPDFDVKDLAGNPLSIAKLKGKVVLVDFWATWCGPCVGELPNVIAAYEKHHTGGFEIIGISLDSDRSKLEKFIKDKNMPWVQFFDGKGWKNEMAVKYGVQSIPATYLLDAEGKIIGSNLRGEALEEAIAKALAEKKS